MKHILVMVSVIMFSYKTSSEIDYRKVFGKDYKWAINWLQQNNSIISVYSNRYKIPAKELRSIIFPELIRYNRVFDVIQVESLKYLYVTEGKPYADFSVGFFQMKPSFAEKVEHDADPVFGYHQLEDTEETRRARLVRLTRIETQVNYLCAFYRLCEKKFRVRESDGVSDRIKLFATAYNAGYSLNQEQLKALQSKKHFSGYNYSDISVFYFNHE